MAVRILSNDDRILREKMNSYISAQETKVMEDNTL